VRVEGSVTKVAESESDAYFMSRPLASRISTMASPQSRPIASRAELEQMVRDVADRAGPFPARPVTWGGYRITPERVEFWQGRAARLHDRLVYEREGDGWRIVRLAP
jgi:pyridoxamine 5'-phosphate oxidase